MAPIKRLFASDEEEEDPGKNFLEKESFDWENHLADDLHDSDHKSEDADNLDEDG